MGLVLTWQDKDITKIFETGLSQKLWCKNSKTNITKLNSSIYKKNNLFQPSGFTSGMQGWFNIGENQFNSPHSYRRRKQSYNDKVEHQFIIKFLSNRNRRELF